MKIHFDRVDTLINFDIYINTLYLEFKLIMTVTRPKPSIFKDTCCYNSRKLPLNTLPLPGPDQSMYKMKRSKLKQSNPKRFKFHFTS